MGFDEEVGFLEKQHVPRDKNGAGSPGKCVRRTVMFPRKTVSVRLTDKLACNIACFR